MKVFDVVVRRIITESKCVSVRAETAKEAEEILLDGILPVQFSDGHYLSRKMRDVTVCAIATSRKP